MSVLPSAAVKSAAVKSVIALAAVLTFAVPAHAAMPVRPTLHVTTLDGKTFDLGAQRGKWVIVNYWATWCGPCVKEMPDISRFVASHGNVAAIGLAFDDSKPAAIKAFLLRHPVVYPVAQVTLDHPVKDFDVPRGLPTSWVIAPDGTVAKAFLVPITIDELTKLIDGK